MDSRLKQRLVGAAVLVALAVIFLPMLVQGPAPDSGVSNVPLSMPDTPRVDVETRDLPLVAPGQAPEGGAVGMATAPATTAASSAPAAASSIASPATTATTPPATTAAAPATAPATSVRSAAAALPATTAAGDYAVAFGSFSTIAAADRIVAALRSAQLPGFRQATTANGKPAWRVRIGPYATRAEAESARLRATHVRDDLGAQVVTLDAAGDVAPDASTPPATSKPSAAKPATVAAKPVTTAAPGITTHTTGFALQLAAYSKPEDANALRDRLRAAGFSAFTETVRTDKGALTRVRVGPVATRTDATLLKDEVKAKLGLDGVVRPHP
ncbi:SPOR domain-containing protein [Cognatiluteimonas telluris]|uniref:SPOR domain-containing protein n=1 Tax=Cognatiluteimonas telluris TaxID=1104775 RepID=UPI00140B72D6|nr:SPOR domain-containing protein [Lysobacter telluris]